MLPLKHPHATMVETSSISKISKNRHHLVPPPCAAAQASHVSPQGNHRRARAEKRGMSAANGD